MSTPLANETIVNRLIAVITAAKTHPKCPLIVAIDGNCGSGKSFYAEVIAQRLHASVIHCDDFFLPVDMRTDERLNEVGGNIHYERLRGLLVSLKALAATCGDCNTINYKAYDCATDSYRDVTLPKTDIVIVEGSYALHQSLRELYDVKFLFTVDRQIQLQRLRKREGDDITSFINKWIPLEDTYLSFLNKSDCIVIDTSFE